MRILRHVNSFSPLRFLYVLRQSTVSDHKTRSVRFKTRASEQLSQTTWCECSFRNFVLRGKKIK